MSATVQDVPAAKRVLRQNNGIEVPQLSFGTFGTTADNIYEAIRAGVRHVDTASFYQNEKTVGEAIAKAIADGLVKREELFVTTKLWNTHHAPADVRPALEASLSRLGLPYVDLFLIHFPIAIKNPTADFHDLTNGMPQKEGGGADILEGVSLVDTWRAMEALVDAKLTRSIGVSNYSVADLEETVKAARILPTVNQVELHAALPQVELRAAAKKHGILTAAYSALGTGVGFIGAKGVLHHPKVAEIAKDAGLSVGDLLLRYVLELPDVITIFKSSNTERIHANAAITSAPISNKTRQELEAFGAAHPLRTVNLPGMRAGAGEKFFGEALPSAYEL